jgi:hypothetical protein
MRHHSTGNPRGDVRRQAASLFGLLDGAVDAHHPLRGELQVDRAQSDEPSPASSGSVLEAHRQRPAEVASILECLEQPCALLVGGPSRPGDPRLLHQCLGLNSRLTWSGAVAKQPWPSSGLGAAGLPLKVAARVRIPLGVPREKPLVSAVNVAPDQGFRRSRAWGPSPRVANVWHSGSARTTPSRLEPKPVGCPATERQRSVRAS